MVRALLALYPARFRRRFGAEITESAEHELSQAMSPAAFAATSARELSHAVSGILPQHRRERHRHRAATPRLSTGPLESVAADARHAARGLRRTPAFTAVAIGVLALGIGSATAIFSVVDAVVLRGLPFPDDERLVVVLEFGPRTSPQGQVTTVQTFLDWRKEQRSFETLAGERRATLAAANANGEPVELVGQVVTHGFFETLGVQPMLGRSFTSDDEQADAPYVAILSHAYWQRQFGGDPGAIGRTLDTPERQWRIVGVMPDGFSYPVATTPETDVYMAARFGPADYLRGGGRTYAWTAIGRLRLGVTVALAQEDMSAITAGLDARYPAWYGGARTRVVSLHHRLVGNVRDWLILLLGSTVIVLLIAGANVANLMLARATVRVRETGIRAALGAGRWRLIRLQVIEGLLLAVTGAACGILLAYAAVSIITASLPSTLPRAGDIAVDLRVLGIAVCASVLLGGLLGLLPALQASRTDVTTVLRDGGRAMTARRGGALRSALVVAEVALAVMLLVGAGLFTASFIQLMRIDTGFDHDRVLTFSSSTPFDAQAFVQAQREGRDYNAERSRIFMPRLNGLLAAVAAVPGVERVAAVNGGVPLTGSYMRTPVFLPANEGREAAEMIDLREVTAGYLELLRIPLVRGRYLTEDDVRSRALVIVINEAAAARYWPGTDALGQQIAYNRADGMRTVVGIVGNIRHLGPEGQLRQEGYVPFPPSGAASIVLRTTGEPEDTLPLIKRAVWSVDPRQYIPERDLTLSGLLSGSMAQRRFNMALLSLLGMMALVIAAAGVYGVMAYIVSQRRQEIGVRMALGARPGDVVVMVMKRAGVPMVAGLAIGGAAAWLVAEGVQPFLFLVASNDRRIFAAAALSLAAAGLVACALPARRAARVDPLVALRTD